MKRHVQHSLNPVTNHIFCAIRAICFLLGLTLLIGTHAGAQAGGAKAPAESPKYKDRECLMCHSAAVKSEKYKLTMRAVKPEQLHGSVHANLLCVQCHKNAQLNKEKTHMISVSLVECGGCHYKGNTVGAPQKDIAKDYYAGVHGSSLRKDPNSPAPHCWDCHTGHSIKKLSGRKQSINRETVDEICKNCHYDITKMKKYKLHPEFIVGYEQTPHAKARARGKKKAAACPDCHGNHNIHKRNDPANPLNKKNVAMTCGRCHTEIFKTYQSSIHGADWKKGNRDVPVCTTCHGEHEIRYVKSKDSTVYPSHVVKLCLECHGSILLRRQYKLTNPVPSYEESYHGVVNRLGGDSKVANCASCHGTHNILPSKDPKSNINKKNIAKTCGKCHRQAMLSGSIGRVHVSSNLSSSKILYYLKIGYILMIAGSIGGMLFYVFTDLFGFIIRRRRALKAAAAGEHHDEHHGHETHLPDDLEIERWPKAYRIQHGLLLLSFTMLVITGMPLVMPDFPVFKWLGSNELMYEIRGTTHRVFGFLMIALCIYHVIFVMANRAARRDILNMIPKPSDAIEAVQSVLFNLTIKNEHPSMPRYNFIEKFEYLAMAWGSFVMVATGLILTFNSLLLRFIPKVGFDIATIAHKFEAILATLAIIIWHMYTVHLCPDFFPMNRVFLSGKISLKNLRKHHGREYEETVKELEKQYPAPEEPEQESAPGADKEE